MPIGTTCTPANRDCDYPQGRCECAQNVAQTPGSPGAWSCASPGSNNVCASPRPRLGTACYPEFQRCDYGSCEIRGGTTQECRNGVWIAQPVDCSCPASLPKESTACSRYDLTCEYGSSNLASCNTMASCSLGHWSLTLPEGGAPCVSAPASACPDAGPSIQGSTCTEAGLDCDYGGIRCECNSGPLSQSETTWRCDEPALAGPGCGPRPLLGRACPQRRLTCDYGSCEIRGGSSVACVDVWLPYGVPCFSNVPVGGPFQLDTCSPEPQAGTSCFPTNQTLLCEYGTSPLVTCDTVASCNGVPGPSGPATWVVTTPDAGDPLLHAGAALPVPGLFRSGAARDRLHRPFIALRLSGRQVPLFVVAGVLEEGLVLPGSTGWLPPAPAPPGDPLRSGGTRLPVRSLRPRGRPDRSVPRGKLGRARRRLRGRRGSVNRSGALAQGPHSAFPPPADAK